MVKPLRCLSGFFYAFIDGIVPAKRQCGSLLHRPLVQKKPLARLVEFRPHWCFNLQS